MKKDELHARVLYLYQILRHYSDSEHPLTTQQILKIMDEKYHIQIHRVSVQNYVEILNSCGIKVNQQRAQDKYYYLDDRTFDIPELKLMIDAVQASHFIPEDKTNELIDKLLTLTSDYNADRLRENIYFANKVKVPDSGNYVIVESISKAIHAGKKISFQYFEYDVNKNRVLRHDGKPYIISPYTMIWNGDYYYVVGFYDGRQEVNAFRVDRINACPEILPDDIVPIPEDFDPSKYSREVFRMYGTDEIVEVSLLCNSNLMMHVIDQFGIDVDTKPVDDEHFQATIQIYPSPTFYRWVFGWGGKIKIESPSKIRKEYQTMLSLYTFSLSSLLEIMLSGNFKEEYITGIKEEIESLSMTYRDLYGKCSEYLERLGNSALEANLLKGIGSASNAVGRLIGSIPKIKDGQVDEFLQDSGERLKNNAVGMERNVVKAFAEISNPGTGVFTEKMRDMILIYNHTAEICFDDKQIYLIAE